MADDPFDKIVSRTNNFQKSQGTFKVIFNFCLVIPIQKKPIKELPQDIQEKIESRHSKVLEDRKNLHANLKRKFDGLLFSRQLNNSKSIEDNRHKSAFLNGIPEVFHDNPENRRKKSK